ncbi:MAG: cytochrome c oxidase assembly protein subunit 15 [Lentimonas sp.]
MQKKSQNDYHKGGLSAFCIFIFVGTLCLLYAGGFTTTIGAGMAFPDWPLSNGSLNPDGWVSDPAMRAEHGHRLLGSFVGSMMIILCIWTYRREVRPWVRKLTYTGLVLVILQGLLGGARVLAVEVNLAIPHAVLAQIFLCTLATISLVQTQLWGRLPPEPLAGASRAALIRKWGIALIALTLVQLSVAAVMRHQGAGLAIPSFPFSTAEGALLPQSWPFAISIHFTHRVLALILTGVSVIYAYQLFQASQTASFQTRLWRVLAIGVVTLVIIQVLLGASVIWTLKRHPSLTTFHVIVGALFLTWTWLSVVLSHKGTRTQALNCSTDAEPSLKGAAV